MYIAHIESSLNWGGQELRVIEQMEWLLAHGHQSIIIARPKAKILDEARQRGLPFFELEIRGSVNFTQIKKLIQFLIKNKVDILDAHSNRDATYAAFVKLFTKIKVIRSRHVTNKIKDDFLRTLVWKQGNHAIITTAHKIKSNIINLGLSTEDKVFVAPAGVDENKFLCTLKNDLKQQLNIPPEKKVIVNVGMIRTDKGQLYFIKMAELLAEKYPDTLFLHLGEATKDTQSYKKTLLNHLKNSRFRDQIRFLGYKTDIENYLAITDIVVIASISTEAQTRLVSQCFLMKKNVVATTVGGLPEMIVDNETGLLCEAKSAQALADKVSLLLKNPDLKNKIVENAYQHAQEYSTFDYMMKFMLDVYQQA